MQHTESLADLSLKLGSLVMCWIFTTLSPVKGGEQEDTVGQQYDEVRQSSL